MSKETAIQSLITQHPDIASSIKKLESVKVQLDSVASKCLEIKITDELSLSIADQNLSMLNGLLKIVEETRVKEKEPHLKRGKAVDSAAKYITATSEEALAYLKKEKISWITKVQNEKKRIDDIKAKVDNLSEWCKSKLELCKELSDCDFCIDKLNGINYEKVYLEYHTQAKEIADNYIGLFQLKKQELEATPDELEAILEAKEELIASATEAKESATQEVISAEIKKVRYKWRFECLDLSKVPLEWLKLDEEKVKTYISENKEGLKEGEINGVRLFKEISVTA